MKLPSLYEISTELAECLDSDDPEALARLDDLVPMLEHKAEHMARWIEYQTDSAALLKAREEKIREERKTREARVERAKTYLLEAMQRAEVLRITDSRTGTEIKLAKNPPKVVVDNEFDVPDAFWVQPDPPPKRLDLVSLKKAMKEWAVPGCHVEQGWRVEIKG